MSPQTESAGAKVQVKQFVVFVLDSEEYAVPILTVTEVVPSIEITPVPGAPAYIAGLINLRGKVLPVLDLEKKFGLSRTSQVVYQHIMVAESEQKALFGILVDQVMEVLKISEANITPTPQAVKSKIATEYLGGVIILDHEQSEQQASADDRMLLVLDLQKILSDKNIEELRAAQTAGLTPENNKGGYA